MKGWGGVEWGGCVMKGWGGVGCVISGWGDIVKQPMKKGSFVPKNVPGVGWGGWVMKGWGRVGWGQS